MGSMNLLQKEKIISTENQRMLSSFGRNKLVTKDHSIPEEQTHRITFNCMLLFFWYAMTFVTTLQDDYKR